MARDVELSHGSQRLSVPNVLVDFGVFELSVEFASYQEDFSFWSNSWAVIRRNGKVAF